MSLIMKLPMILEEGYRVYLDQINNPSNPAFQITEIIEKEHQTDLTKDNILARGDNGLFMCHLLQQRQMAGKVHLIYIDPPFFSKTDYGTEIKLKSDAMKTIPVMRQQAYHDTWENGMEDYLKMLTWRLFLMRDLLSEDGSIFVHLDWHASHYVKIIMDEIFGEKNFINEIIWQYKSGGVSKRHFARKHDSILFYAKSSKYYFEAHQEKSYNRGYKPYRFKGVKEYRDEMGWYTMVNRKDVWQLDMVGRTSAERTGYVTQKPEALIQRILESCTREGDLCADFFGGSGTMAAAAFKMGRRWISCDSGKLATINSHKRLIQAGASYSLYEMSKEPLEEMGGTLRASVALQPSPISDKMMLHIKLTGYENRNISDLPVDSKFLPVIESVMSGDSLQLVDYWSVDTNALSPIHRPDVTFHKENESIETVYEAVGNHFGPIRIKAVDIFGNTTVQHFPT